MHLTKSGPDRFINRLAVRNLKRSERDYFVYFFILTLSVALFYSFNSVSTQFASLGLEDTLSYLSFFSGILNAFSIVVCAVMGALVVYANRFMMRRRKREMGVYATLGMRQKDLRRMLLQETLCIGVFSLGAGIVLGLFLTQILSLMTARLMGLELSAYRFMISVKAVGLSILFFGILFYFVHLFNVRGLKKLSLLDMLYAERENESLPERRRTLSVLILALSLLLILGGYAVLIFWLRRAAFVSLAAGGLLLAAGTVMFVPALLELAVRIMKKTEGFTIEGFIPLRWDSFLPASNPRENSSQ